MEDVVFKVTVGQKGDINGDGTISLADITAMVDIVMGIDAETDKDVADMNGDGEVTLLDITILSDIVLGKED